MPVISPLSDQCAWINWLYRRSGSSYVRKCEVRRYSGVVTGKGMVCGFKGKKKITQLLGKRVDPSMVLKLNGLCGGSDGIRKAGSWCVPIKF